MLAAAFVAFAAAAGIGVRFWLVGRFLETTDNAYVRGEVTIISPKVQGYVAELNVADNQSVAAGDVLVRIDDADYRAAAEKARADVESKRAALANIDSRRQLQLAVIDQSTAAIDSARAGAVRAKKDLDRAHDLLAKGWVTHQRFDAATAEQKQSNASVAEAEANAAAARRQIAVLDGEAAELHAQVAEAEASRRLAEVALDDTVIRAPVGGTVGNRHVHVGEFVRAGTQLFAIVPLEGVWVVANYKETQLARMRVGNPVDIRVDTFPGEVLHGHVDSLSPSSGAEFTLLPPDNATGNFTKIVQRIPVKIVFDPGIQRIGALRPGMSVEATADTRRVVPTAAATSTPRSGG